MTSSVNSNSETAIPGSGNGSFPAPANMNFRHPNGHADSTFGASASQRQQLLSALLSEGIASSHAPVSLQSLEALQLSSAVDRPQTLSTVNRALHEQLLMNELLRSPNTTRNASQTVPLNLLDNLPVPPFQGYQNQAPRMPASYSTSQQRLVAAAPSTDIGMLPPRAVDMLRSHPTTSANVVGTAANLNHVAPPLLGLAKGFQGVTDGGLKKGDDEDDQQKKARPLPPRKRRKTVNFRMESSLPETKVKSIFPLPPLTEDDAAKVKFITASSLCSFRNLWGKLEKAKRGRKEFFRRRLQKAKVPVAKKGSDQGG